MVDITVARDIRRGLPRPKKRTRARARARALMIGFKRISTWQIRFRCPCAICTRLFIITRSFATTATTSSTTSIIASTAGVAVYGFATRAANWIVCRLTERLSHNSLHPTGMVAAPDISRFTHFAVFLFPDNRVPYHFRSVSASIFLARVSPCRFSSGCDLPPENFTSCLAP